MGPYGSLTFGIKHRNRMGTTTTPRRLQPHQPGTSSTSTHRYRLHQLGGVLMLWVKRLGRVFRRSPVFEHGVSPPSAVLLSRC